MKDKIFDSYFQVEKKDHREGFGLGLSLTKSLIHMHKGEIKVESEVGKGSEFIVSLNVSESAYSSSEKSLESARKRRHISAYLGSFWVFSRARARVKRSPSSTSM